MKQFAIFLGVMFMFYMVGIVVTNWETISRIWT